MKKVKYTERIYGNGTKIQETTGYFEGWGVDYEEFDEGPGNYTAGIIRHDDGSVKLVHASSITFLED